MGSVVRLDSREGIAGELDAEDGGLGPQPRYEARGLPHKASDGSAATALLMRSLSSRATSWTSLGSCDMKSVIAGQIFCRELAASCRGNT